LKEVKLLKIISKYKTSQEAFNCEMNVLFVVQVLCVMPLAIKISVNHAAATTK
jgi:hypothetical protein